MRIYVENEKPKLFVFDNSPCDWDAEPGVLVDTPFSPETHSIGNLEYNPATGAVTAA